MKLTKIHVDLPNHWFLNGESLWARKLAKNTYEIRNIPFVAYGLNHRDVVRTHSMAPDVLPQIVAVVRRRGHRTLRVVLARVRTGPRFWTRSTRSGPRSSSSTNGTGAASTMSPSRRTADRIGGEAMIEET